MKRGFAGAPVLAHYRSTVLRLATGAKLDEAGAARKAQEAGDARKAQEPGDARKAQEAGDARKSS
jgi:hypothetical protein